MAFVIQSNKAARALAHLGFVSDSNHPDIYYHFYHKGQVVVWTKISHGPKHDISGPILRSMLRQIFLSFEQFKLASKKALSKNDYIAILKEKRVIH